MTVKEYDYKRSIKSTVSDELINTYLLRPVAALIVAMLYRTPVTPNQVTIASTVAGLIAAKYYLLGDPLSIAIGGLCMTVKDIFDSADGQLARAKDQYSRRGRFLDSLGDFVVDVSVFGAIGWTLYHSTGKIQMLVLAACGLIGITLRVSYHVFYQVSFLHLGKKYDENRITEEITEEDKRADRLTLLLQRIFLFIYGWQDRLMFRIDEWCRGKRELSDEEFRVKWYGDSIALRASSLLGFGTELFLLMVCSVLNELELYLYLNLFLMNGIMLGSISYRRLFLSKKI